MQVFMPFCSLGITTAMKYEKNFKLKKQQSLALKVSWGWIYRIGTCTCIIGLSCWPSESDPPKYAHRRESAQILGEASVFEKQFVPLLHCCMTVCSYIFCTWSYHECTLMFFLTWFLITPFMPCRWGTSPALPLLGWGHTPLITCLSVKIWQWLQLPGCFSIWNWWTHSESTTR